MSKPAADVVAPDALWWGTVDYQVALDRMIEAHARRVAGEISDQFFYLEHDPVITYGRATPQEDLQKVSHNIPTREVPRGGLATYHGPGQLVGYIVMNLFDRAGGRKPDIHAYLRALELGLINFLREEFGLRAGLRQDFTGVWTIPNEVEPVGRKLASIGVSARKWVTSHGFALNIHPEMDGFRSIIPCGITDAEMSSVELEVKRQRGEFRIDSMEQWAMQAHKHVMASLQNAGWLLNGAKASCV